MAVGSAFYLGAALGAGPRDSLMLVARAALAGGGSASSRTLLESSVVVVGGRARRNGRRRDVAFALLIGPAVESSLWVLSRSPLALPEVASRAA